MIKNGFFQNFKNCRGEAGNRDMGENKNIKNIVQTIKPYIILVIMPVLFTCIFASAMSPVYNSEIPVAIYDMDSSAASRMVVDMFQEYPYIQVTEDIDSVEEIEDLMLMGQITGAVILPEGFETSLESKSGAEMLVLEDATNFMNMNVVLQAASNVTASVNGGIQLKLLEGGGIAPYEAEQYVYTMNIVDRSLYNPSLGYIYFLFPALLAIFSQQTFLAASTPWLIDRRHRASEMKAPGRHFRRGGSVFDMAMKMISFMLFSALGLLLSVSVLERFFDYNVKGSMGTILILHAVFLTAMTGMALIISSAFEDPVHCTQFNMFLTVPTLLSCGYAWPEYLMPDLFRMAVTKIWPLYYYANPLKDVMLKGSSYDMIAHYVQGCARFAAVWLLAGALIYSYRIYAEKKRNTITRTGIFPSQI